MIGSRSGIRENLATVQELLTFFWRGKTWWLTPVIFVLFLLTFLVLFGQSSAVAPFIYVLF